MKKFKNNKGITLTALIITVIVLTIIAGTAVYTGTDVLEDAKEEAFIQELQMIQNAVNNEVSKIEAGQKSYADYIINPDKIDEEAFIEYTANELQTKFGITGIKQNVKINLITKEVKSVDGINIDGETKYSLNELVEINQIKPTDNTVLKYYVQDGLILHLDGINNNGEGHDSNITYWKDLVTRNSMQVQGNTSGESIWSDKAFVGHGVEYFSFYMPELYKDGTGTVETLVSRVETKGTFIGKFQGNQSDGSGGGYGSSLGISYEPTNGKNYISFNIRYSLDGTDNENSYDMSSQNGYQDKILDWSTRNYHNISAIVDYNKNLNNTIQTLIVNIKNKYQKIYNDRKIVYSSTKPPFFIGQSSYEITNNIYHVRVYNRALTEQEAIHNQYIDIYRYGIK